MRLSKETETIEYKKTTGELKETVISIVAMLNKHNQGEVYFGVRNDGEVVGQTVSDKTLRDVSQAIANHITPEIRPTIKEAIIDCKSCIHVRFEGENVPYFAYDKAYIRVSDEDRVLSPTELREYFTKQIIDTNPWDSGLSAKSMTDIDEPSLVRFIEKANSVGRLGYAYTTTEDILSRLDLMENGRLTNAARVLFCKNSGLEIQMATFATNERLTFTDIKRESATLQELVFNAERYIKSIIKWRVEFDGSIERKEIPEIPIEAIREALVNSFCHKDYRMSQNNEVCIFKNRIEIYNPGTFPKGKIPQDFIEGSERSVKRNPQLAQMLYYSKDVETFGTGLRRITYACRESGVKVDFQMLKSGFVVVFYRDETENDESTVAISSDKVAISSDKVAISSDKVAISSDKVAISSDKVAISSDKIVDFLRQNGKITNSQVRILVGVGAARVGIIFRKMCADGIIEAHGGNRDRFYTLK